MEDLQHKLDFLKEQLSNAEELLANELNQRGMLLRHQKELAASCDELFDLVDRLLNETGRTASPPDPGNGSTRAWLRNLSGAEWIKALRTSILGRKSRRIRVDRPRLVHLARKRRSCMLPPEASRYSLVLRIFPGTFPPDQRLEISIHPGAGSGSFETVPEGFTIHDNRVLRGVLSYDEEHSEHAIQLPAHRKDVRIELRLREGTSCLLYLEKQVEPGASPGPAQTADRGAVRGIQTGRVLKNGRTKPQIPVRHLMMANELLEDEEAWLGRVNDYLRCFDLAPVMLSDSGATRFDRLRTGNLPLIENGPKVSVLMAAYNAEATIEKAARSILDQTWRQLELIIIDDCSTDGTWSVAERLSREDSRVKLHRNAVNLGCDIARNPGIDLAEGDWISTHDADDWAHPERIERHVKAAMREGILASYTYQVRMTPEGEFTRLNPGKRNCPDGAARPCGSSALIETKFFKEQLGYYDSVKSCADAELFNRAQCLLGDRCRDFFQLGMISLDHDRAETRHPIRGFFTGVGESPVIQQYGVGWKEWHKTISWDHAYMPFPHRHTDRLFPAPALLVVPDYAIERVLDNDAPAARDRP